MAKIEDGGPAFPEAIAISPAGDVYPGMGGMSLRDWFAGQALVGLLANPALTMVGDEMLVKKAGELSDAMLEACAALAKAEGEGK